jgi:hypothetical protein
MVVRRHRRGVSKVVIRRLVLDIPVPQEIRAARLAAMGLPHLLDDTSVACMNRGSQVELLGKGG